MDIKDFLLENAGWEVVNDILDKKFDFNDYGEVRSFVNKVADLADKLNHHPTVTFSYNWVRVETTSHDEGNVVTNKDLELAGQISVILYKST